MAQYLGKGHMVFTVDQLNEMQPYQGIVALEGASLVECVQHYFNQSEQIKTAMYLAAGLRDGKMACRRLDSPAYAGGGRSYNRQ